MDQSSEERFWAKVNKTDTCWLWIGGQNGVGYGVAWPDGKQTYAHRFAYELLVGPIPSGLDLDHLCRVRYCVRPDHLEPVTRQENLRRGRGHGSEIACPRGHPYDEGNTRVSCGHRFCRTCDREYQRRKRAGRSN
jgi:hypothetical protein